MFHAIAHSRHRALFSAALFCIAVADVRVGSALGGAKSTNALPSGEAARVASAVWSARQDMHTGVFRARWHYEIPPKHKETASYTVAFDFDRGFLRYDKREEERNRRIQEVRRPDERLLCVSGAHVVSRLPPGEEIAVGGAIPIDPRTVGTGNVDNFRRGTTWRQMREGLSEMNPPVAIAEEGGIVRLNWELAEKLTVKVKNGPPKDFVQRWRQTAWIDTTRGFSTVRRRFQASIDGQKEEAPTVTETKWTRKGGTYLPVECLMYAEEPYREGKLTLEWVSVNEPVDEKLFTIAGLQVDPDTLLVNHKLGPKIIEKQINQRKGSTDEPAHIDDPATNRWRLIATGGSLAVIALGLIALMFRRREEPLHSHADDRGP